MNVVNDLIRTKYNTKSSFMGTKAQNVS